eukprot:14078076-Ditylum_brightwellii.AAC.1
MKKLAAANMVSTIATLTDMVPGTFFTGSINLHMKNVPGTTFVRALFMRLIHGLCDNLLLQRVMQTASVTPQYPWGKGMA